MAGTVPGKVVFAVGNAGKAGVVFSSWVARYSQAAWDTSSQAHLASPAATRRAPPQASGTAKGRRQASARAAEHRARATSRSSARVPATTSARKLRPSLRPTAVLDERHWVPSQMLAGPASAPRKSLSSTEAEAPPEVPLLAFVRAALAQARASASTRSLLVRRPASASRYVVRVSPGHPGGELRDRALVQDLAGPLAVGGLGGPRRPGGGVQPCPEGVGPSSGDVSLRVEGRERWGQPGQRTLGPSQSVAVCEVRSQGRLGKLSGGSFAQAPELL